MSDLSGWAQAAVGAVAIVASGIIATQTILYERRLVRREENRRRLDITTTRWPPAGLQLDIRYLPEFTHIGMLARIKLLSPVGAVLHRMDLVQSVTAVQGSYARLQRGGPFIGSEGTARLVGHGPGQPFTGAILLLPSQGDMQTILGRGRIAVTVETDAGEVLLQTAMDIGPTDDGQVQAHWEMSPSEGSSI